MPTILDCYTDEPAGLGVPPYLGVYPRYIAGRLMLDGEKVEYLTIDDARLAIKYGCRKKDGMQTQITTYNLTREPEEASRILQSGEDLIVICGVHVPGKYLSALPGTLREVNGLMAGIDCRKILTGPAASDFGTRLEGGKKAEKNDLSIFSEVIPEYISSYDEIADCAVEGAKLVKSIPYPVIAEIETARGCPRKPGCSFCTEPLKHGLEFRNPEDIISEAKALHAEGVSDFRLGKQSDFFAWSLSDMDRMLKEIRELDVRTLHIDNVDPANVTEEKVAAVVRRCTPGNVAALGIESFDRKVAEENNLNSTPEQSMEAIKMINRIGLNRGDNGMPAFLPGINLLFGLKGETRRTHEENMRYLKAIYDEHLLVRRINIRQVAAYPGTRLFEECADKFIRKNKRFYWKWRNEIRQNIDNPMLKRLVPIGTVLKEVRMEIHDGNTTFGRQRGTYPLIVGVKQRLELASVHDIRITGHMLRSVFGEIIR